MCSNVFVAGLFIYVVVAVIYIQLTSCTTLNSVSHGVNVFGDRLSKEITQSPGNAVFSPYSIHAALSLLALAAKGDTLTKLLSVLSIASVKTLKNGYRELATKTNNSKIFHVANTIVINKKFAVLHTYLKSAKRAFNALARNIAFDGRAENVVNKWVSQKTQGKIKKALPPGTLTNDMVIVIFNAIYFKDQWKIKFDKSKTQKDYVFHGYKKDIKCEMMIMEKPRQYMYLETDNIQALEMDFQENAIKIVFIRPISKSEDLRKAQELFSTKTFFDKIKSFKSKNVFVKIPKFKISGNYDLKSHLRKLGLGFIFGKLDLSNMYPNGTISVSTAVHKAMVEINVKGVTAVAVTNFGLIATSLVMYPANNIKFELDRPFIFYLYDKKNKIIYFHGKIEDPTA